MWALRTSWALGALDAILPERGLLAAAYDARRDREDALELGLDLEGPLEELRADLSDPGLPRLTATGSWLAGSALAHGASLRRRLARRWRREGPPSLEGVHVVVIAGLHRTGTTLLQGLLGALPGWRTPRFSELHDPLAGPGGSRLGARVALALGRLVNPEMEAVHPVTLDAPEECWMLLLPTLAARNWDLHLRLPRYRRWLDEAELGPPYRFYARALATLVSAWTPRPRVVVVKCPEHLWALEALVAALPLVTVVWPHRDPRRSIASYASLSALQHRALHGRFAPDEVVAHVGERFADGVRRAMEARARLEGRVPFIDVAYERLVADPAAEVSRIAREVEPGEHEDAVRAAVHAARSERRRSRHRVEDFAIDEAAVREAFAGYRARFGELLG